MNVPFILIIGDNADAATMWAHGLKHRGMQVEVKELSPGFDLANADYGRYALVLVDAHTVDGVALCKQLRTHYSNPLLLMTYERDERYHLQAYASGVEECIVKPLGNSLFLAKVEAWLRRVSLVRSHSGQLIQKSFRLNPDKRSLRTPEGHVVRLSLLESRLVTLLMYNSGRVLDHDLIISNVWNDYSTGDHALVKNLMYRVRRKIEPDFSSPRYIQTVAGGYIFWPDGISQEYTALA